MKERNGFILVLVIVILTLVGAFLFVLTGGTNTMLFHADTAHLRAVERNLTASGLAWARQKVSSGRDLPLGESFELDVGAFAPPATRLAVQVLDVQDGRATIHVETACSKGRRTLETARSHTIRIP